ncbi:four helix bundle protein, partial [Candidatus Pacebacteria bacterium]|nr:four helix bundle protein [Candidatus Paceibacterota bacterium]
TKEFPDAEKFGLINQMRRCAVSTESNIAEGHARKSDGDFHRFLRISYGSASELETQLIISRELEFVSQEEFDTVCEKVIEVKKMLNKLMTTVSKS